MTHDIVQAIPVESATLSTEKPELQRHPDLKVGEAFCERLPRASCSKCHGTGTSGHNLTTGFWEPCVPCLKRTSWREKLRYHIRAEETVHRKGQKDEVTTGRVVMVEGNHDARSAT